MFSPNQKIKDKKATLSAMAGGVMAVFPLIFTILPGIGASVVKKAFRTYMNSSPCICNEDMTTEKLNKYDYPNERKALLNKLSTLRATLSGPWRFPPLSYDPYTDSTNKSTKPEQPKTKDNAKTEDAKTEDAKT